MSQPFCGGPESKMLRDVVLRMADGQRRKARDCVGVRAVRGSRLAEALLGSI